MLCITSLSRYIIYLAYLYFRLISERHLVLYKIIKGIESLEQNQIFKPQYP